MGRESKGEKVNIPYFNIEAFASKDPEARAIMQAPWLDVEGKRLLATDGRMAARYTVTVDDADFTGTVPIEAFELVRKEVKVILKVLKEKDAIPDPWLRVTCHEENVEIENLLTNTKHFVLRPKTLPEHKFHNVDAVLPKKLSDPEVTLDRDYLGTIAKNLDGMPVSLFTQGPEKCVTVASSSGKAVVVIMPMRVSLDPREVLQRGAAH